jgi:hypothetical protein
MRGSRGAGEDRFVQAAPASTLSADSPAIEAAPVNTLAASLRGLLIALILLALIAVAGVAIASATVGYPIGRLG